MPDNGVSPESGPGSAGVVRVGADHVSAPGGRGPPEYPRPGLGESPAGPLLELVVAPAEGAEVAGTGQPALIEWHRVVEVAAPGRLPAAGAAAGLVAGGDVLADSGRWPVGRRGGGVGTAAGCVTVGVGLLAGLVAGAAGGGEKAGVDAVGEPGVRGGRGVKGVFGQDDGHAANDAGEPG